MAVGFGIGTGKPPTLSARLGLDGRIKKKRSPPPGSSSSSRPGSGHGIIPMPRVHSGSNLRYVSNGSSAMEELAALANPQIPQLPDFGYGQQVDIQDDHLNVAFNHPETQGTDLSTPQQDKALASSYPFEVTSQNYAQYAPQPDASSSTPAHASASAPASIQANITPSQEPFAFNVEFDGTAEDIAAAFGFLNADYNLGAGDEGGDLANGSEGIDFGALGGWPYMGASEVDVRLNWDGQPQSAEALPLGNGTSQPQPQPQPSDYLHADPRDQLPQPGVNDEIVDPTNAFPGYSVDVAHHFFQQMCQSGDFEGMSANSGLDAEAMSGPMGDMGLGLDFESGEAAGYAAADGLAETAAEESSQFRLPSGSSDGMTNLHVGYRTSSVEYLTSNVSQYSKPVQTGFEYGSPAVDYSLLEHRSASGSSSSYLHPPPLASSPSPWNAGTPHAARNSSAEFIMTTDSPAVYDPVQQYWYSSSPHRPAPELDTTSTAAAIIGPSSESLPVAPYHRSRNYTGPIDRWEAAGETNPEEVGLTDKMTPTASVVAPEYVPPVGAAHSGRRVGASWSNWVGRP